MDEKQKPKRKTAIDPIEIASGVMLLFALFAGLIIVGLVFLIVIRLHQDPRFSGIISMFLVVISLNVLAHILLRIKKGYGILLQWLRARRDSSHMKVAETKESTYIFGDDGEIIEVVDDEKRKRSDADSTVE